MIKKLIKRLGFVKPSELTEDELTTLLVSKFDNPFEYRIDKESEKKFFDDLSKVDNAREYLRAVEANDIKLYFGADDAAKKLIKGAYLRTKHWRSKLVKNGETVKSKPAKLSSPRYA
jgi:hypothetical protein